MQTPIETGSPAAAWHLACRAADWLALQAVGLAGFWQTIVLVVVAFTLIGLTRRMADKAAQ